LCRFWRLKFPFVLSVCWEWVWLGWAQKYFDATEGKMAKKKLLTTRLYALYKSLEIALQRKQETSHYEIPAYS
jgi:hypothetical protein